MESYLSAAGRDGIRCFTYSNQKKQVCKHNPKRQPLRWHRFNSVTLTRVQQWCKNRRGVDSLQSGIPSQTHSSPSATARPGGSTHWFSVLPVEIKLDIYFNPKECYHKIGDDKAYYQIYIILKIVTNTEGLLSLCPTLF